MSLAPLLQAVLIPVIAQADGSPPTSDATRVDVQMKVMVPMRDGGRLGGSI